LWNGDAVSESVNNGSSGDVLQGAAGLYPDPRRAPWPVFSTAADAAVEHLNLRLGMDLWMVTEVVGNDQIVVASAGYWADAASPGAAFSWKDSFCLRMVEQRGPMVASDVAAIPEYAELAHGPLARVRSYVGVPLEGRDGRLFGTLSGLAGRPQAESLTDALDFLRLVGQMLSTILAREHVAQTSLQNAAAAAVLAEHDGLTGLQNRRGWESALAQEEQRSHGRGTPSSIVVLDLDDLKRVNDTRGHSAGDELLARCASVLTRSCRPTDTSARLGGDEFGVLAVGCDAEFALAVLARIRSALTAAGVVASSAIATRRAGEPLAATWQRADEAMYRDKRSRTDSN
jgi:diguanylate cyclase